MIRPFWSLDVSLWWTSFHVTTWIGPTDIYIYIYVCVCATQIASFQLFNAARFACAYVEKIGEPGDNATTEVHVYMKVCLINKTSPTPNNLPWLPHDHNKSINVHYPFTTLTALGSLHFEDHYDYKRPTVKLIECDLARYSFKFQ